MTGSRSFTGLFRFQRNSSLLILIFQIFSLFFNSWCLSQPKAPSVDCNDKIDKFFQCVNVTISSRNSQQPKLQLMKAKVNECLQKSKCARMYNDVVQNDATDGGSGGQPVNSTRMSHSNVHQCIVSFREYTKPQIHKCVSQMLPGTDYVEPRHHENRWALIQQAMNKTILQHLCSNNVSATDASNCISRIFTPRGRARQQQEKRFKEFCAAARQCQMGMGVCRTELDNGRKAMCDCTARMVDKFDTIRPELPTCAGVPNDALKNWRKFHSHFQTDCGPDPCDSSFETLTNTDDDDSPENDKSQAVH